MFYKGSTPNVAEDGFDSQIFRYSFSDGTTLPVPEAKDLKDKYITPDGTMKIEAEQVKLDKVRGNEIYGDLEESNILIYDDLHHRHRGRRRDGSYNHLFISPLSGNGARTDIMQDEPYDTPTVPFGGSEDYTRDAAGEAVIYV